tara:strand:- start:913 stop:1353 length:441 start_codon:yes stop_codon:yes gene_type:complete
MSKLLTEKQENFARLVSNGEQLTSAYRKVYDVKDTTKEKSVWEQASALASSLKVSSRISELCRQNEEDHRTRAIRRGEYVLKKLTEEVERVDNRSSDKIQALHLLGKTVGLFTDKVEVENTSEKSASELEAELENKLSSILNNKVS